MLIEEQIRSLASRLGRAPIEVVREPTDLRLPPGKWRPFWSAFSHVIRNAVDHGVETADERKAGGKTPHATVELAVRREGDSVVVTIREDGRGIAWDKIAARARAHGLPHATAADLEKALFADGVSSRGEVTSTSGRGVGLRVVGEVIADLGGHVEIRSDTGRGTTFRFVLPQSMLSDDPLTSAAAPTLPLPTLPSRQQAISGPQKLGRL